MRKRRRTIAACLLTLALTLPHMPVSSSAEGGTAYARTQRVEVAGVYNTFEAYALKDPDTGYETNYVKLRDLALSLRSTSARFEVDWDGAVNIVTGQMYTPNGTEDQTPWTGDRAYAPFTGKTRVDGVDTSFDAITLTDDAGGGYTYYKLRDLGEAIGFGVSWDPEKGIVLDTAQAARRLAAPDLMAYFGLDKSYRLASDGSQRVTVKVTVGEEKHQGELLKGFLEMMERQGFRFQQVSGLESGDDSYFWGSYRFRYTGTGSDRLRGLGEYDGEQYDLHLSYDTYRGYTTAQGEVWNHTVLEYRVAEGLSLQEPGERDGRWDIRLYETVPAPIPKPAPKPTAVPAPTPSPKPVSIPTPAPTPEPVPVRVKCGYCGGTGEIKCPTCRGAGVRERWDPVSGRMDTYMCPTCYYAGTLECPACGGDGWLDGDEG